ncbi:molybdopterin biosynthesis protein [Halobacteriales archaeon SW_12_69_24]|nr:MAG: molybdopterin biosynthesis protein [Halobacteriales archaeon SW_12_69_24]
MRRKEFRDLASPEEARQVVDALDLRPDDETVPLREARGRVLAARIEEPVRLDLAGEVHAGVAPDVRVDAGTCVEVSTGAVLPPGADAVVMVERTERDDGAVLVRTSLAPGDRVMFAGADVAAGERALGPGTVLTPREVGLLSALGVEAVPVRGRPTVGVISTGDELVRPGQPLDSDAGEIHDVNSYTIATAVEEAGGEARLYPHTGDDYDAMEAVLREAADDCDLVLSSGSTSASAVDVVYRVIEASGELLLHGVAVKPGKPMLVGRLAGSAYVGLPGYPVSALTIFRTFVAPAIRDAAGLPDSRTATVEGAMAVRERYAEGRLRYMPVGLLEPGPDESLPGEDTADGTGAGAGASGGTLVYPVDKGSGATTSLVEADGVVAVPRPRYLGVGSRQGLRRLRDGVTDVAVVTGEAAPDDAVGLGGWRREWGLVVPAGNPDGVDGLADLVDNELGFVNRTTDAGLRGTLGDALAELAEDRGVDRHDLVGAIDGFEVAVRAHESPARKVQAGAAEAGLGLRSTAEALGTGFVPCGAERVRVFAAEGRREKPGVRQLERAIEEADDVLDSLPGYGR